MSNVLRFPKKTYFKTLDRVSTCEFCVMTEAGEHHPFCLVAVRDRLKAIGKLEVKENKLSIELAEV